MKTPGMLWGLSVSKQGQGLLLSQGQGGALPPLVLRSSCLVCAQDLLEKVNAELKRGTSGYEQRGFQPQ